MVVDENAPCPTIILHSKSAIALYTTLVAESPGRNDVSSEDLMARHIERVLNFRAKASPAYQSMTYVKDPVEHAFELTRQAGVGARTEVEFRAEYDAVNEKCRKFAVSILDSCRNSSEVEQVLL